MKRILSGVIAFLLVLSLVPANVFALNVVLDKPVINGITYYGHSNITEGECIGISLATVSDEYEQEYEVLYGTTNNPTTQAKIIRNYYGTLYIDADLASGNTYYFKVRRCHGAVKSEWSAVTTYTHKELSTPSFNNIEARFDGSASIGGVSRNWSGLGLIVSWDSVSNATKYIVTAERKTSNGTYSQIERQDSTSTSALIHGYYVNTFIPGEILRISVQAYSSTYNSYSDISVEEYQVPNITLTKIKLDSTDVSLSVGESVEIEASLEPYNPSNRQVNCTSSNPEVATARFEISTYINGYNQRLVTEYYIRVTGHSPGRTIITCYSEYGDAVTTFAVTVTGEASEPGDGETSTEVSTGSGNCGDDATWTLDENGVLTISGTGAIWNSNNYTGWKNLRKYIKEAKIEEGITEIGEFSFSGCTNLEEISLPDSLVSIKESAFSRCSSLETITIPKNVSTIENNPFMECASLAEILVADENQNFFSIDEVLFDGNNLKLVTYPHGKTASVYTVPNGIEAIGTSAFHSNEYLTNVILPESLITIGEVGFGYCKKLTEITIPDSVSHILASAFAGTGLSTVKLPANLEMLSPQAFYNCDKLDCVVIPKSLVYIARNAFCQSDNITHINYEGSESDWSNIVISEGNNILSTATINYNSTHIHSGGTASCSEKAVCEDCHMGYGAYAHELHFVEYKSATCTSVGWSAYEYCKNCDYTTYKETPTSQHTLEMHGSYDASCDLTGNTTYYKCTTCNKLFEDAAAESEISRSDTIVQSLGHSYSTGKCIRCEKVEPGKCGDNLVWDLDNNGVLTISGTGEMWDYYSWTPSEIKEVIISSGATSIGDQAFKGCNNLTKVSIPSSVTYIGKYAFYGSAIEELVIPNSVTEMSKNALYGCSHLKKLTLPYVGGTRTNNQILGYLFSSTTSSSSNSFGAIIYTTTYHIPATLEDLIVTDAETITSQSFKNCSNIKTITLPNTLTSINAEAFTDCDSLTTVYFEGAQSEWDAVFIGSLDAELHIMGVEVERVTLNKPFVTIYIGDTDTLIATVFPEEKTNKKITWSSSNDNVVTVNNGVIVGISAGTATITATSVNGKTAECQITVCKKVTGVYLNKTELSLLVNETETLRATVLPADATNQNVIWYSSNESVATVSDGIVTTIAPGTAIITVETQDGGMKATANLTITCNHIYSNACDSECNICGHTRTTSDHIYDNESDTICNECGVVRYKITFQNYNGAILSSEYYYLGEAIEVPANPTRAADNTYTYAFSGWNSNVVDCAGTTTYIATYTPTFINYTVVFKNWNGTVLSTKCYHWGDEVTAPANPTRAADNTYTYTFAGWDTEVVDCAGNVTYTATYTPTYINYTVVFKDWNGTILSTNTYHWGGKVTAPADPTKDADNTYAYTFAGWDKKVVDCAGNVTYTATYDPTYINYTIVFKNWNGTVLSTKTYHWGEAIATPANPTRPYDENYIYTFAGWDNPVVNCAGDTTYTATYSKTTIAITSIAVTTKPAKTTYVEGDAFEQTGMIVTAYYNNNTSKAVTGYTISGYTSTVGTKTITVTYEGKTATFAVTVNSKVPANITSSQYTINGGNISKITAGTTVSALISGLNEGSFCKVYKGNTEVSGNTAVGTGMVIKIMDGNTVKASYTVIVTGDTNGDGNITVTDMIAIKAHVLKKSTLSGVYASAADTNGDSGISITDFIQVKAKILGKGTITAR